MRFDAKVAIVTGAGRGIGAMYARALASEGASVAIADLDIDNAETVAAEINSGGGSALAVRVDVADQASTEAMAKTVTGAFGGIDYLVNNAAIYGGMKLESVLTVDMDYYRRFVEVNLNGALHCSRACRESLVARGGVIVNQSSIAAWSAGSYYAITKAAINSLTVCLASDLGPQGVRVNALAPGYIDTDATVGVLPPAVLEAKAATAPLRRLGHTEDLVGACLFLLSDAAAFMTGQVVVVDGGMTIRI
jgi:NAD(P)-dependent dehydrogenase (short-subunit alcohol dehydrogenase family)